MYDNSGVQAKGALLHDEDSDLVVFGVAALVLILGAVAEGVRTGNVANRP